MNGDLSTCRIVSQPAHDVPSGLLDNLPSWQIAMQSAIRDARQLCQRLGLPEAVAVEAEGATGEFPVFVPLQLLDRIGHADPRDPVLLQVLPREPERMHAANFSHDPVQDGAAEVIAGTGLLQKYAGRALWVVTGTCPVHCRYCFRRHFQYQQRRADRDCWDHVCQWLSDNPTIEELILSGGDPMTWADERWVALVPQLESVSTLHRLRIHSRMPIMIPQRITHRFVQTLTNSRFSTVMVVHANHAQEIDEAVAAATKRLLRGGIPVLNQSVLLRGVNDSVEALESLSRRLIQIGVMPYYLHQLDRVAGAAHFEVPEQDGIQLIQALRSRLPGYAVPRYVREVPGEDSKSPIDQK